MWESIARTIRSAVVEGEGEASFDPSHQFKHALRHSADVFAAFKVHRLQRDITERLTDEKGNLRSFSQWRELVMPIASHQCHQWLRTEYDTAVLRARNACEWQQFEAERDVLPNLKWLPSTSPTPGADHQLFWNTVLPIDHPFWASHRPGDRWNCKCQLIATAEPATSEPTSGKHDHPHSGLENNTGKDGHLFSDKHPYFPSSCGSCSLFQAKAPITARAKYLFLNRKKDCYNCPYANQMVQQAESREEYTTPTVYGKRLKVSIKADKKDLADNLRVSKAIVSSEPNTEVKIRPHVRIKGVKNPELDINERIADNKRIQSEKGVKAAFQSGIEQGCKTIVLDLDAVVKKLRTKKLSKFIGYRHADFENGTIEVCYVVYKNKAVRIDKNNYKRAYEVLEAFKKEVE